MIVVSDTTPLIGLASINRLGLLHELFDEVYIPQAVFDETVTHGREESKAKKEVSNANWIHIAVAVPWSASIIASITALASRCISFAVSLR
jgi:predicted nucleic acid-binding protein